MREVLDQIEARYYTGDVPRLLAAVRAVEQVVNRLGRVDGDVSQPAPSYYVSVGRKVVADEVRRALTEALDGK